MKFLTKTYWEPIMAKKKGEAFENLVKDILPVIFPELDFKRTKKSHDGKKDFLVDIPIKGMNKNVRYHIECKNYKVTLSINILSPTLVVAFAENVSGVIFFSYSPLNENAKKYLAKFQDKTKQDIRVYADESLENEILKHPHIIKKYFPTYKHKSKKTDNRSSLEGTIRFHRDLAFDYDKPDGQSTLYEESQKVIKMNECFCLDIFLDNNSVLSRNIEIRFNSKEFENYLFLLDDSIRGNKHTIEVEIPGYGFFFKRLVFKLIKYRNELYLPKAHVHDSSGLLTILAPGKVRTNWVIDAPLIGGDYNQIVEEIRNNTAHRNCAITYCIYGESGTGKSRILSEAREMVLRNGYQIFFESGEFQNKRADLLSLLRRIVSSLSGLPLLEPIQTGEGISDSINLMQGAPILWFLYSKEINIEKSFEKILGLFWELFNKQKPAIIIDNVQFYDENTAHFFYQLLSLASTEQCSFALVISFNTDMVFKQTKMHGLLEYLKGKAFDDKQKFFIKKITGFTDDQARMFVRHCIPELAENYPKSLSKLIERAGKFPLFIEQTLLLLYQEGVLVKETDFFTITSPERFHKLIDRLPDTVYRIIDRRWELLLETDRAVALERTVRLLNFFQKIPQSLFNALGGQDEIANELIELGVFQYSAVGELTFHHRQLALYFSTRYKKYFSTKECIEIKSLLEELELIDVYPAQYFYLLVNLRESQKETIQFGVKQYLDGNINQEYIVNFAMALYDILMATSFDVIKNIPVIKVFVRICEDIKMFSRFSDANDLFTNVYKKHFFRYDRYVSQGDDYYFFILRYVNSFLALHRDDLAHEILLSNLEHINSFQFNSETTRKKAKASLLNRLCVTAKSLGYTSDAENAVQESMTLAVDIEDKVLIIKNYIDQGYIYYKNIATINQLRQAWTNAWSYFTQNYDPSIERERTSVYHHKSLLELIDQNYEQALALGEEALRSAEKRMDVFNRIKILLQKALSLHLSGSGDAEEVIRIVREAIDQCVLYISVRSHWTSYHLLAKVSVKDSLQAFNQALLHLKDFSIDDRMERLYHYFFIDWAIAMRRSRKKITELKDYVERLSDGQNIDDVKRILKMSDGEFDAFLENFVPSTPISDGQLNYPCP